MFSDVYAALGIGMLLGMRHATDSDHVVTITTIVELEKGLRSALRVAIAWGLGHSATFFCMGVAIVLFGWQVPAGLEQATELAVACLLVGLGVAPFLRKQHAPMSPQGRRAMARPFMAGLVHGLAGSAGVALLVLTTIHDTWSRMGYLVLFGLGTIAGMCALTVGIMVPVRALFANNLVWTQRLHYAACTTSVVFGGYMAASALL